MKALFKILFLFCFFSSLIYVSAQTPVEVDAKSAWVNTNYFINNGDSVTIIASGYVTMWMFGASPIDRWLSPAGYGSNLPTVPTQYCPTCPEGSLVGRIGTSGTPFYVGATYYLWDSQESGDLYLAVNDANQQDNFGKFIAIIFNTSQLTSILSNNTHSIDNYSISQNYPNPFNPNTTIEYQVTSPQNVNISIYDINGRLVRVILNEEKKSGNYSVIWNGKDEKGNLVASGTYFYQIKAGDFVQAKKMILLK